MSELVPQQVPLSAELRLTIERALEHEANSKAPSTRRAYAADWADFSAWCARLGFEPLPAGENVVRLYLSWLADVRHTEPLPDGSLPKPLKLSTIERRLSAIAMAHRLKGLISPTDAPIVKEHWKGIRRAHHRARSSAPKRAIQAGELRELVGSIRGDALIDVRDRALLLLTFLGAFRRSEVAALTRANLDFDPLGVVCRLEESKTNQLGDEIERVAISRSADPAICAVRALERWLAAAGISEGAVFRSVNRERLGARLSSDGVYDAVRRRVLDVLCAWLERNAPGDAAVKALRTKDGRFVRARFSDAVLDDLLKRFALPPLYDPRTVGAHSLRSGFVTTARRLRKPDHAIRRQTRHKTTAMLDRYTHSMELWDDNASRGLL